MVAAFSKESLRTAISNLENSKTLWLISPWDTYGDEFLSTISRELNHENSTWIKIDFAEYKGFDSTLDNINNVDGFSFQALCDKLSKRNDHIILIDNIFNEIQSSGKTTIEEALSLCHFIQQELPNINVVLRSRAIPSSGPLVPVILRPMDEPDSNRFILNHPLGSRVPESSLAAGEIFRMSEGRAGSINRILEKLSFTRLSELANESSDMAVKNVDTSQIPSSLIAKVNVVKENNPEDLYPILQCLAIFPYGEDIAHLKYFQPGAPFYPMQSGQLVNMGLLEAITHGFFEREDAELPKVVCEISPAQSYIRHLLSDEYKDLTDRALSLYFGKDWRLSSYKLGPSFSDKTLSEFEYSILNASSLLRRSFNDAVQAGDPRALQDSLGLLNFYTSRLENICYYRHICNTCHVLINSLANLIDHTAAQDILFRYANSLRMLDELDAALELYQKLLPANNQSRKRKASILLHISMIYDEQDDAPNAIKYAKLVKDHAEKRSATHYHAESIIICLSKSERKFVKLGILGRKCHREEHFITANNITLRISHEFEGASTRKATYLNMAKRALKEKDIFNYIKSTIYYVEAALKSGEAIPSNSKMYKSLVSCYDFTRTQRMNSLFGRAHNSLWSIIESEGNINLLGRLFRLSSLIYRLNQDEPAETEHLNKLIKFGGLASQALHEEDRGYLLSRMDALNIKHIPSNIAAALT